MGAVDGVSLYFTDLTAGELYEWKAGRKPEIVRKEPVYAAVTPEPSGRVKGGIRTGELQKLQTGACHTRRRCES